MSGRHRPSIWTPPLAFLSGATIVGVVGAIILVNVPPEIRTVTETQEVVRTVTVEVQPTSDEINSAYIQQQAAALPNTTFDDVRVATPLAVNICENLRNGQRAAAQPGLLEAGTYKFDQIDAWYFTELAIRTYCPEFLEDLP